MNEELQNALTQVVNKALQGSEAGVEFLSGEIPDVLSQLLLWYGLSTFLELLLGVVGLVGVPYLVWKFSGRGELEEGEPEKGGVRRATLTHNTQGELEGQVIPTAIFTALLMGLSSSLINLTWLQIWIAPKVWIIEYTATLTGAL
jgi:hypothetical protein